MAYGEEYYANEKLRRYDLSWQDPNPADESAPYTTTYEVWRNGEPLATVDEPEYTDTDYIPSPWYEVYIVRSYEGYARRVSAPAMAGIKRMKAAAKPAGVSYTPQEEKQSEYLNSLYGGNYTFSAEPRIPDGDAIVLMSRLGLVDLCSYGLEPVNFNTGNFLLETLDGQWTDLDQTVTLQRSYNTQSRDENGLFGAKWASSLNEHEYFGGSFLSGWLGGEISGALTGAGLGYGGKVFKGIVTGVVTSGKQVLSSIGTAIGKSFAGGYMGGFLGNIVTNLCESKQLDEIDYITASKNGVINGTIAALSAPFGLVTTAINDASIGISSVISSVNEAVYDLFSADLQAGGS